MAFFHPGIIHFPEIPLLEILDVWKGYGPDDYKLLYRITRGIWSRNYVIVMANHFAYSLIPQGGGMSTLEPKLDVRGDHLTWRGVDGALLHYDPVAGDWILTKTGWGEKYYSCSFGNDSMTATPVGWPEEDNKQPVDYSVDWPRWECSRSGWGTGSPFDAYSPASTYATTQTVGTIYVGQPCWNSSAVGRITRGLSKPFSYYDQYGNVVFKTDSEGVVTGDINGYHYEGNAPTKLQSWSITGTNEQHTSNTLNFSWYGWDRGVGEGKRWICEMGRLL